MDWISYAQGRSYTCYVPDVFLCSDEWLPIALKTLPVSENWPGDTGILLKIIIYYYYYYFWFEQRIVCRFAVRAYVKCEAGGGHPSPPACHTQRSHLGHGMNSRQGLECVQEMVQKPWSKHNKTEPNKAFRWRKGFFTCGRLQSVNSLQPAWEVWERGKF